MLPALPLFLALPWLLRAGLHFFAAPGLGPGLTALAYAGTLALLRRFDAP